MSFVILLSKMSNQSIFSKKTIIWVVSDALTDLYKKDLFLITQDVNERSISHKLACYLEEKISLIESGWNIDCEYNRVGTSSLEEGFVSKALDLPVHRDLSTNDTKGKTVFPDVIAHHRGGSGDSDNLLVIEIKKNKNYDAYDFKKIEQYGLVLGYRYGFYLNITDTKTTGYFWERDGNRFKQHKLARTFLKLRK